MAWARTDTPEAAYQLPPLDRSIVESSTLIGSPEQVVEALGPWVEEFGRRRLQVVVRLHYPGMTAAQARPAIELFAERVVPALRLLSG
jgi:alkanesulfonate monooxygenase SsuD/methylene tetrahydromethanopterin reductase-like flavin-dependent oxidoreductase (luciferase family)